MVVRAIAPQRRPQPDDQQIDRAAGSAAINGFLCQWLTDDPVARALIDRDRRILWTNPAALDFLANRRDLAVRNDTLVATDPAQDPLLIAALDSARTTPSTWEILSPGGDHIVMQLRPLDGDCGIMTVTFWRAEKPGFANLMRLFDLTKSEHAVLRQLLNGRMAEAIADHNGVKLDTVRTQIRAIYAKLGVSSREGLFDKAMAYSERR
jgi:DNA-binding CsgD family transcriptional regulator